jgi:hypothetical protein
MADSEEDISGDITAGLKVNSDLASFKKAYNKFHKVWTQFEEVCVLFFEHLDLMYRTPLQSPLLCNLDSNIEKLKQVISRGGNTAIFSTALQMLEIVRKSVVADEFKWVGSNIYMDQNRENFYACIYPKTYYVPVKMLDTLSEQCSEISNKIETEFTEFRMFQESIQLILLLYIQRQRLSPASKQMIPHAFQIMCQLLAENIELEKKMCVGFVKCQCADAMDIVFKPAPVVCRTYDLFKTMSQSIRIAREELNTAIAEMVGFQIKPK